MTNTGIGTSSPISLLNVSGGPVESPNYGTLSLGGAPFDGTTSGHFAGSSIGTSLAINESGGYTGTLADFQIAGNSKFSVDSDGDINIPSGGYYNYGGAHLAYEQTSLHDYYFGEAGNMTETGNSNIGTGLSSLVFVTTGSLDSAYGVESLAHDTTGGSNTAVGYNSLVSLTTGTQDVGIGYNSGGDLTTGSNNTFIGTDGTSVGITTGSYNTIIGSEVTGLSSSLSNNIILADGAGNIRAQSDSSGNWTFTGTPTLPAFSGASDCTGTSSALGTTSAGVVFCNSPVSDQRLKTDITSLDTTTGLAAVEQLNPVSFYWQDTSIPETSSTQEQYGFIAQQVGQVLPNLVFMSPATPLTPGGTYTLNYQGLTAVAIQAIKELDTKVTLMQSIDPTVNGSLASLIVQFLQNAVVNIKDLTVNTLHIDGDVCIDSTCVTKDQFKQLLLSAGATSSSSTVDTTGSSSTTEPSSTTSSSASTSGDSSSSASGTTSSTNDASTAVGTSDSTAGTDSTSTSTTTPSGDTTSGTTSDGSTSSTSGTTSSSTQTTETADSTTTTADSSPATPTDSTTAAPDSTSTTSNGTSTPPSTNTSGGTSSSSTSSDSTGSTPPTSGTTGS